MEVYSIDNNLLMGIPQWVPYVAGGETLTQFKSASNLIFISMKNPLRVGMDTGKSLRKTGISPSGEIPSCPHNALLEILSKNHARVVPDGFLRDLPVSMPALSIKYS